MPAPPQRPQKTRPRALWSISPRGGPVGDGRTHVAVLEAIPLGVGRFAQRFLRHHVKGDTRRLATFIERRR